MEVVKDLVYHAAIIKVIILTLIYWQNVYSNASPKWNNALSLRDIISLQIRPREVIKVACALCKVHMRYVIYYLFDDAP